MSELTSGAPKTTDNHPTIQQIQKLSCIVKLAYQIANVRDHEGVLVNEVRVSDEFLKELRLACGVKQ